MIVDILGHLCYIAMIIGTILIALRRRAGWLFEAAGAAGLILVGLMLGMTSIWIWNVVFVVGYSYGWLRWKNKRRNKNPGT